MSFSWGFQFSLQSYGMLDWMEIIYILVVSGHVFVTHPWTFWWGTLSFFLGALLLGWSSKFLHLCNLQFSIFKIQASIPIKIKRFINKSAQKKPIQFSLVTKRFCPWTKFRNEYILLIRLQAFSFFLLFNPFSLRQFHSTNHSKSSEIHGKFNVQCYVNWYIFTMEPNTTLSDFQFGGCFFYFFILLMALLAYSFLIIYGGLR